ncbi:hypothetical protein [Microtetraspora malaysiensis]|uniref:Uncharacterized protein n=1 Tax=Microtetraspora malaysiensis TaxID=161358 RepID=A0ABW6T0Q4_9ACTN
MTLPEEIRDDRDDMGNFCVYDEKFVRRRMDYDPVDQPELHAWNLAQPRWSSRFRVGGLPPAGGTCPRTRLRAGCRRDQDRGPFLS